MVAVPDGRAPRLAGVPAALALLLALGALPARATGTISAPFDIGRVRPGVGLPGDQYQYAAAFDGTNYLVAFVDHRRSVDHEDLYAARVSPAGVILDTAAFPICTAGGDQDDVSVAFDGVNYLVAWTDERAGNLAIYAARVTTAGVVLDKDGFKVRDNAFEPSVASLGTGTGSLVAWTEYTGSNSYGIAAAKISPNGAPSTPFVIHDGPADEEEVALASNGAAFLATWTSDQQVIEGARITAAGAVVDMTPLTIGTGPGARYAPHAASDGADYFVVWDEDRAATSYDVYGTLVTSGGSVVTASGIATSASLERYASIAFDGFEYMVVYADALSMWGMKLARFDTAGNALDMPGGLELPDSFETHSAVACSRTNNCLISFPREDFELEPNFLRVDTTGTVLGGMSFTGFSVPAAAQFHVRGASDGNTQLMVFDEARGNDDFDVYAVRVSDGGVMLDANDLPIATGPGAQRNSVVDFAFGNFLVAWTDDVGPAGAGIYVQVVSPSGATVGTPRKLNLSSVNLFTASALAHDDQNWVIAWSAYEASDYEIHVARITPAGDVLDPSGVVIGSSPGPDLAPEIAFNGSEYLVVWNRGVGGNDVIAGERITPGLVPLDGAGGFVLSATNTSESSPRVASDGRDFLVSWRSHLNYPDDVALRRVRADGTLGPTIIHPGDPRGAGVSTIAHDGHVYWVVFESEEDPDNVNLYSLQVTPGGTVIDDAGVSVATFGHEELPHLFRIADGQLGLVYNDNDDDAGVGVARSRGVFIATGAAINGGFCDAGTQCQSGFCADGVCCDSACGGSDPNDCLGCSEGAGAAVEGTCGPVNAGVVCRAAIDTCDVAEVCDGVQMACPADVRDDDAGMCAPIDAGVSADGGSDGGGPSGGPGAPPPPRERRHLSVGIGCSVGEGVSPSSVWCVALSMIVLLFRCRRGARRPALRSAETRR